MSVHIKRKLQESIRGSTGVLVALVVSLWFMASIPDLRLSRPLDNHFLGVCCPGYPSFPCNNVSYDIEDNVCSEQSIDKYGQEFKIKWTPEQHLNTTTTNKTQ